MKKVIKRKRKTSNAGSNTQKRKKRTFGGKVGYSILTLIVACAIICVIAAGAFFAYIAISAPEFDANKLYEKEASLIYDANGNLIATLGVNTGDGVTEKRQKVTYDELPEVLIDAIIATEDSRYFQHNGFDLPRFAKASLGQLLGSSSAGGASTITMQVSKNSFTSLDAEGITGIIRKFTDIYMSIFKIEKYYTKEEILELYVNYPYLGSGVYGVEQAAQVYFGKDISDISLPEAALIAGLFQSPGAYDPYVYPEDAQTRRDIVLNLMVRHGYISDEQAELAKKISVQEMLISDEAVINVNEYQGFIDTVIQEVIDKTGNNPYDTPMIIYSTMVASKQKVINNLYKTFSFKDKKIQLGNAVIDNKTGALIAVGAGRNKTSELSYNYATMLNRHIGSTAKPLFDYGPGIEYESWSTYTPFFDNKLTKYTSGETINNWNSKYEGISTLRNCLAKSKNTCAVQAFQKLENSDILEFVLSLGMTPEIDDNGKLFEAHALGAFTGTNPVQLAAAYASFANGGYYVKPYSFTKIIYRESGDEYNTNVTKTRVMSKQTAYMITNILYDVTPGTVSVSGTRVATKTGTSSYDYDVLKRLGLPSTTTQDVWFATYSPDYTITNWMGYDELSSEYYITMSQGTPIRNKIQGILCNKIMEKDSKFTAPSGLVYTEVELETIPAMKPSANTPSKLIEKHYFISGTEPTETSTRFTTLENPSNLTATKTGSTLSLSWESPSIPSAVDTSYLSDYFESGFGTNWDIYYKKRISYNNSYIGTFGFDVYLVSGSTEKRIGFTTNTSYTINLNSYSGSYDSVKVKSAYSIYKTNRSSGVSYTFYAPITSTVTVSLPSPELPLNSSWNGSDESELIVFADGNYVTPTVTQFDLSSITDSSGSSIAIQNLTKQIGTYTLKYSVTFTYLEETYSRTITQSVSVVD